MRSLPTLATLAIDNLRSSRGQAAYLVVTLAIAVGAWLVLAGLAAPFVGGTATHDSGIGIQNGSQNNSGLPLSYARRIEAVRGADGVAWTGVQVVKCTAATMVPLTTWGGPGVAAQLRKQKVPASVLRHWQTDRLGVVFSQSALAKCNWQIGQNIAPATAMGGKHIALHIVGTFTSKGNAPIGIAHYDYVDQTAPGLQGKDKVMFYHARAKNPRDDELLAARIEAAFAHDFPTVNATTNATTQNAWARFGKVQQLLAFVMAAILLCAASVLVSVLAHTTAQRRPRLAVLQVLGFQRATLFSAAAMELLVTVIVGAAIGFGLARLVAHMLAPTLFGMISNGAQIPMWAWWGLPAWLAVLFVAALAWPATLITRLRPADYRAT